MSSNRDDHDPQGCRPETCGGIHYDPCADAAERQSRRVSYARALADAGWHRPLDLEVSRRAVERLIAVADAEQEELRAEVERLQGALRARPERTTVWQDASDEGFRLQVAHAESQGAAALRRAEAAEAKVAKVEALLGRNSPMYALGEIRAALAGADQ